MKLLVAHDNVLVCEGVKRVFQFEPDIRVIGVVQDGDEAVRFAKKMKPDVILLKMRLAKLNAFSVVKRVRGISKTIVMADCEDYRHLQELEHLGVLGCLSCEMTPSLIIETVKKVGRGEKYFSPAVLDVFLERDSKISKQEKQCKLTAREIEVLQLIGKGMSNMEIAQTLFVSEKTVKNHLTNIFKKINVTDRTQALLYAIESKIILLS